MHSQCTILCYNGDGFCILGRMVSFEVRCRKIQKGEEPYKGP